MPNLWRFFATGANRPVIQDAKTVDELFRHKRFSVMMAITVGYGVAYTCRLGMSVVKKPLIDEGIFTANELGTIGFGIFCGYAFGKLINGFLADHANVKRFFAFGVMVSALINLSMGRTPILWVWVLLWGLNGWFQGYGAPTGAVSLANWFSNRERGFLYGLWSTAHSFGEGLTFFGTALLVTFLGWESGFWGPGLLCIFAALAIYYFMEDRPQTLGLPTVADWKNDYLNSGVDKQQEEPKKWRMQLSILKFPSIWILGLSSSTMYMTRYAINSWGILYLQEAKGYTLAEAGALIGLNTFSGIVGCVAYGYISDKYFNARRPPLTLIFGIVEVIALLIIFYGPPGNTGLLTIAVIIYGFTLSGLLATLGGLFAIDIAPRQAAGAAMGFIGVFSYLGAAAQEKISGVLIERGITVIEGVRHYDFTAPILFWVGASVISLLLATSLWRVRGRD